jgi:hypothetical protein
MARTAAHLFDGGPAASPRTVILSGQPGSGLTSAAIQVAGDLPDSFPGGQLYVDLRAGTALDGLRACLRAFGVPADLIPQRVPELHALYRRCVAEAATLVVLDGVTEPAQVYGFVPSSAGSVVIVVSHNHLSELTSQIGAVHMRVPPLDADQGSRMLAGLCGATRVAADPAAAADLVRLCGGLPATLTIAGAWLAAGPSRSVVELVDAVAADETAVIRALIARVCRELPEQDVRLCGGMTALPVLDFTERVAQEATATTGSLARVAALGLLVDQGGGVYRLPSVVANAVTLAKPLFANDHYLSEWLAVQQRAVRYYVRRIVLAEQRILGVDHPGPTPLTELVADPWDGLAPEVWVASERLNLLAITRAAHKCGLDDEAVAIALSLAALHESAPSRAEWVTAGEVGAQAARRVGDRQAEVRLWIFAAHSLLDMGYADRAGRHLEKALPVALAYGDPALLDMLGQVRVAVDEASRTARG